MPLPKPEKDEERSDFISRCISFAVKDGMEQKQATAACYSQWKDNQNGGEKKAPPFPPAAS